MSVGKLKEANVLELAVGTNDANNEFASANVVANVDGSLLERLEKLQQDLADVQGVVHRGACTTGDSTTAVSILSLAGFGNDFFNTDWIMACLIDINGAGSSPEGEIRDITDYVSATGAFTTAAFDANIEAGDIMLVARRELFIIDGVALKAAPISNSLAAFIASGGTALGQELPDSTSLVDIIGDFTGPHDGAIQDDNVKASLDLAHTDLDTLIAETSSGTIVRKTVEFDGGAGNGAQGTVALFTVTGDVRVKVTAICSDTIVGAGTLECGVAGATASIIAQIANATDLITDEIWFDATPTTKIDDDSSIPQVVISNGQDIILTIGVADLTDGTIKFVAEYEALSTDGVIV